MSKRRPKRIDEKDEWQMWIREHQDLIDASGLPPLYISTAENWGYYLEYKTPLWFDENHPPFEPTTLFQKSALVRTLLLLGDLDTATGKSVLISLLEHIDALPRKK